MGLQLSNSVLYPQFIMVSVERDEPLLSDYYVGVPSEAFMVGFDGFERVTEASLPKEIDAILLADTTTEEFKSRFRVRER